VTRDRPVGEAVVGALCRVRPPGDVTQDRVDVGQLSTDELVPHGAVQLRVVRPDRVRDRVTPVRTTDEQVAGRMWQRTNLVLLDHRRRHVTPSNGRHGRQSRTDHYHSHSVIIQLEATFQPNIGNMAALRNRAGHYIFALWSLLSSSSFFFFPRLISAVAQIGSLQYFHTWCGLSANLECRSEMHCTQFAANTRRKQSQKIAIWAPSHNFVGLYLRN